MLQEKTIVYIPPFLNSPLPKSGSFFQVFRTDPQKAQASPVPFFADSFSKMPSKACRQKGTRADFFSVTFGKTPHTLAKKSFTLAEWHQALKEDTEKKLQEWDEAFSKNLQSGDDASRNQLLDKVHGEVKDFRDRWNGSLLNIPSDYSRLQAEQMLLHPLLNAIALILTEIYLVSKNVRGRTLQTFYSGMFLEIKENALKIVQTPLQAGHTSPLDAVLDPIHEFQEKIKINTDFSETFQSLPPISMPYYSTSKQEYIDANGQTLVRMMIWNLLSNAFKYRGKAEPEVSISIDIPPEQQRLAIVLKDNAIGFSPEDVKKAFSGVKTATGELLANERGHNNTGKGMSSLRQIIEQVHTDRLPSTLALESVYDDKEANKLKKVNYSISPASGPPADPTCEDAPEGSSTGTMFSILLPYALIQPAA